MANIIKYSVVKSIKAKRFYEAIKQLKKIIEIDPEIHYNASNKHEFFGLGCHLQKNYLIKNEYYALDCLIKIKQKQLSVNIFDLLNLCLLEYSNFEEDERWYQKMI